MISYTQWLLERATQPGEHSFEKNKSIGWWGDHNHVDVYHGTHKRNLDSIRKTGLNRPDPKTGKISVTPDPHTAHAYASMSGAGGEHDFRKTGSKAVTTPHEDRVTVKFRVPKDWLHKHMDHEYGGNMGDARKNISSRDRYHAWKKSNPNAKDHEYYQTTEFRVSKPIPPEFYAGHSYKAKKE
jgi:hypothetical protein